MAEFDYKCVPVPRTILTGTTGKDPHGAAVETYESIIKNAAKGGWELDRMDTVSSYQKPGCFAALFGKKEEAVDYKLLIFKKQLS
jgi:hypothetical protein